jgi:hypothetical protein
MKRYVVLLASSLLFAMASNAQVDTRVKIQKANVPGSTMELPYSTDVAESAIKDYYSKKGIRPVTSRGFMIFKNAPVKDGTELGDVYFSVDRKSRKDKEVSVVQMFVVKPGTDFSAGDVDDRALPDETRSFFDSFAPAAEAFNLEKQITAQDEVIRKAERKYSSLVDDQSDLEKQIKRLQQKLEDNKRDQDKQKDIVEKEKQAGEVLRGRRAPKSM